MLDENAKYKELTHAIIGCAMKVHSTLGCGFQEVIYQRCLAIELQRAGIKHVREQPRTIFYDGIDVGTRRADFVVDNKVIIELKAISVLAEVHLAQAINYLETYKFEVGLLINFGAKSLEFKRVLNKKITG
jgi:GxxExxY protein